MSYQPADAEGAAELALLSCRALAAAGQGDMIWGHPSVRDPMSAGPLQRWGTEADTIAKRAEVWADSQLQAGWEYLIRQDERHQGGGPAGASRLREDP